MGTKVAVESGPRLAGPGTVRAWEETGARMHHKVVGNFGGETDVRSLYNSRFRFNETSDVGAYTHGRPAK